jgi:hypothetical protein
MCKFYTSTIIYNIIPSLKQFKCHDSFPILLIENDLQKNNFSYVDFLQDYNVFRISHVRKIHEYIIDFLISYYQSLVNLDEDFGKNPSFLEEFNSHVYDIYSLYMQLFNILYLLVLFYYDYFKLLENIIRKDINSFNIFQDRCFYSSLQFISKQKKDIIMNSIVTTNRLYETENKSRIYTYNFHNIDSNLIDHNLLLEKFVTNYIKEHLHLLVVPDTITFNIE